MNTSIVLHPATWSKFSTHSHASPHLLPLGNFFTAAPPVVWQWHTPTSCTLHNDRVISLFLVLQHKTLDISTRKPCYRKGDRSMRPKYGCPGQFRKSLATPRLLFPKLLMGFYCDRYESAYAIRSWYIVAFSVPEIIAGTCKLWAAPGYTHALFSPKF